MGVGTTSGVIINIINSSSRIFVGSRLKPNDCHRPFPTIIKDNNVVYSIGHQTHHINMSHIGV